jgi:hypothetical protein
MDVDRFDHLARALHWRQSRRAALRLLSPGAIGALATGVGLRAVRATHFKCRHVGARCKRPGQCCSGICRNKLCQGHGAGICTTQNGCDPGPSTRCGTHAVGVGCFCFQTTGKAPFCGRLEPAECVPKIDSAKRSSVPGQPASCIPAPDAKRSAPAVW